jgi:hypothetical protein
MTMANDTDILAQMPDDVRREAMRDLVYGLFGKGNGGRIWQQMDAALTSKARQLGDAPEPEDNYWQGVWQIYEIE